MLKIMSRTITKCGCTQLSILQKNSDSQWSMKYSQGYWVMVHACNYYARFHTAITWDISVRNGAINPQSNQMGISLLIHN